MKSKFLKIFVRFKFYIHDFEEVSKENVLFSTDRQNLFSLEFGLVF